MAYGFSRVQENGPRWWWGTSIQLKLNQTFKPRFRVSPLLHFFGSILIIRLCNTVQRCAVSIDTDLHTCRKFESILYLLLLCGATNWPTRKVFPCVSPSRSRLHVATLRVILLEYVASWPIFESESSRGTIKWWYHCLSLASRDVMDWFVDDSCHWLGNVLTSKCQHSLLCRVGNMLQSCIHRISLEPS